MTSRRFFRWLTVLIILTIGAHRYSTLRHPAGIVEYRRQVRESAASVPDRIGPWVGTDVPIQARAIKVLDPNLMISRRYINVEDGTVAGISLVHCADAHDMVGHYPMRCYPAQGWNVRSAQPREWVVGDLRMTGMEYEFLTESFEGARRRDITVINCMFRPDGIVLRDMEALSRSIIGAGGQSSGAGQIQIYFDSQIPREKRDAAVVVLVEGYKPVLGAMLAPVETHP